MSSPSPAPMAPQIASLSWLLGKWRSEDGLATYPTMKPFSYEEELEFFHTGQPNIQFNFNSWHPENKTPMHRETGFIRFDPNSNKVAFVIAMNVGVCSLEEGTVEGERIVIESKSVGRMSFGKEPGTEKVCRTFELKGGILEQSVQMATTATPLQDHLRAKYKKVQ